ncbi:MAG TPA: hypothetical protein DEQ77_07765 [Candidatus Omnitrophica bacterium]|nr:hypothetical protein [Candidatus Omnitrophota bacterium]
MSDKGILSRAIRGMVLTAFLCIGMGGHMISASEGIENQDISSLEWKKLSAMKIYFGHQSVGYNILSGVNDFMRESSIGVVNIKETKDPVDFDQPIFAHSPVGKNSSPVSKIDDFKAIIENGIGEKINVAFFKFCYVDIKSATDIDDIFRHYAQTMTDLQTKYPSVKFAHCTVPLQVSSPGVKSMIKRALGRPLTGEEDNIKRNRFNQLLVQEYGKSGLLFDLAGYESTKADGGRVYFKDGGNDVFYLNPDYTDDGGHLNAKGSRMISRQLIVFLQLLSGGE